MNDPDVLPADVFAMILATNAFSAALGAELDALRPGAIERTQLAARAIASAALSDGEMAALTHDQISAIAEKAIGLARSTP